MGRGSLLAPFMGLLVAPALSGATDQAGAAWPHRDANLRTTQETRSADGSGNNAAHPDWGQAGTPLSRHMFASAYADGIALPPGAGLPSARAVSNAVVAQPFSIPNAARVTDFFWQWGQFLDHDLDLTPSMEPQESMPIAVPLGDAAFDPLATGTVSIPFLRSSYAMVSGVRQQMNMITACVDASNVYGSDAARARALRTLDGTGRLKTSPARLLPFNEAGLANAPNRASSFFLAGDVRANEQVGLTALHTLFVREHNWVVSRLQRMSSVWSDDEIYAMARAIVGAEMQVITYREFLPLLLGPDALTPYAGYRPDVDPGIDNAFSTAAYRFGHSMVSDVLLRLKHNGESIPQGNLPLARSFFAPQEILATGIEPLLRGLATQRAQEIDPFVVTGLRDFLFGPPGSGGFDLAALNIQRGRDHGLQRYNECRRRLGLAPRLGFEAVTSSVELQARLASVYASVEDIDLWVGGLAEDKVPGALVGELFFTILKNQFERLRDGDRFWYAVDFAPWMVQWLETQTLARIIRRNTSVGSEIQDDVFRVPGGASAQIVTPAGSGAITLAGARVDFGAPFPNPAQSGTGVRLTIPPELRTQPFEVGIFDARGRRVQDKSGIAIDAGALHWDGRTIEGRRAQSGVYFVKVQGSSFVVRHRILLIE